MASGGKALMRATEARIVLPTRSFEAAVSFAAAATGGSTAGAACGRAGAGTGAMADAAGGTTGSCGSERPLPARAAACCSSTFACCCKSATCSRNRATNGSISVISCTVDGSRIGAAGVRGRSTGQ